MRTRATTRTMTMIDLNREVQQETTIPTITTVIETEDMEVAVAIETATDQVQVAQALAVTRILDQVTETRQTTDVQRGLLGMVLAIQDMDRQATVHLRDMDRHQVQAMVLLQVLVMAHLSTAVLDLQTMATDLLTMAEAIALTMTEIVTETKTAVAGIATRINQKTLGSALRIKYLTHGTVLPTTMIATTIIADIIQIEDTDLLVMVVQVATVIRVRPTALIIMVQIGTVTHLTMIVTTDMAMTTTETDMTVVSGIVPEMR